MQKNKWIFRRIVIISWVVGLTLVLSSCGEPEEYQFGKVMSEEKICNHIRHMQERTNAELLKNGYKKKSTDSSNINLSQNHIKDRTGTSYYLEKYLNEKGMVITITYNVHCSVLWFEVEMDEKEKDYPEKEYQMLTSFYNEFTNGNISENRIYNVVENKRFRIGEYRLDSFSYPDVLEYRVKKNESFYFFLTGIVKETFS